MSLFETLVRYVREFDPKFSPRPASPAQILELESLAGGRLPPVYRDFLSVMGADMDWITVDHFDLRIGAVIDFYRTGRWLSETRYFRIGTGTQPPLSHPHLEILELSDELPAIVSIPDYGPSTFSISLRHSTPFSGALDEMLAMPVFDMYELNADERRPVSVAAPTRTEDALDRLQAFLEGQAFDTLWFSSPSGRAFRHPEGAAKAFQTYHLPLTVWLACDSPIFQQELAKRLSTELGLVISEGRR